MSFRGKTCRIALVGCGRWGRHILRDLITLGCDVTVVARSEESRQRARNAGSIPLVGAVDQLPAVDGIVIATSTTTHAAVIESVFERNVPIFVEKPLAPNLADAERLVTHAGERLFVMDKWRYHPGVEMLRSIAETRELGTVVGVKTVRVGWSAGQRDVDAAWHLVPHDLAIALEIFGHLPSPRCAVAEGPADFMDGMIGILGNDPWAAFEVSERRRKHYREVRLLCRDGMAVLSDSYGDHIAISRTKAARELESPTLERREISTELPLLRELRAFVEHVRGGRPPKSNAAEALDIVRAITQLRRLAGHTED